MTDNDMTENTGQETQRLGDYLRERRQDAGLTVADFCQKTRISPAIIRAMESGDYRALPAHVFARGFYTLYAKALELNGERIVNWYSEERRQVGDMGDVSIGGSAISAAPETHRMASAGHARPLVTLFILLAILVLAAATLCWRFEVNPVMVIREKIHLVQARSLNRQRHFRIPNTTKVIRHTDEKKKTPLVTLSSSH